MPPTDPYAAIPALYDLEHDAFRDDVECYLGLSRRGPVLEVGCGTGRIVAALVAEGIACTGVEPSAAMLGRARQRLGSRKGATLLEGRLPGVDAGSGFALAIVSLDTLGHIVEPADQLACLRAIRAALAPAGRLVVDCATPEPSAWAREEGVAVVAWEGSDGPRFVRKTIARSVDEARQVQSLRVWYDVWEQGGPLHRTSLQLELHYFFPAELQHLLARAGFDVLSTWGDYEGSPFEHGSPRQVVLAAPSKRAA